MARRRDGAAQLRLAEDALKAGRARDAEELLRKVIANQSLSPEDRRRALQLSEQLHNRGGAAPAIPPTVHTTAAPSGPGDSPLAAARAKLQQARLLLSQGNFDAAEQVANEVARGGVTFPPREDNPRKVLDEVARARSDPKALLTAARAALQAGDLDRAERLAHASKKAESALTVHFWGDSPSRVLEDVQAARTRKGPARPAEPGGVMDSVKNLFQANAGSAGGPPVTAQPGGPPPARPAPGAGAGPTNPEAEAARQLLQQGRKALAQGNFTEARRCAEQARARRWKPEWFDDNPDRLLADLGRAEARHQAPPAGGATQRPGTAPATAAAAGQTGKKEDPRALLAEGRLLWKEGKLDEAAKLAHRARQAQPPRRAWDAPWTLFDDTPEKLLKDIDKARAEHNREEAARLLAEARKMLDRNDLSGAERAAWRAEKLHGPYDIWDLGDRPQKVLADVQAAKARQRRTPVPPAPGALARNDRPPTPGSPLLPPAEDGGPAAGQQPGAGTAPAWNTRPAAAGTGHRDSNVQLAGGVGVTSGPGVGVQSAFVPPGGAGAEAARSRALQLMADARRLQAQGKLVEARHKALEAQHQNAAFGPDEDRPERILLEIGSLASKRMDLLMEKAGDCMATAQANPARWQEAEQNLVQARQLAVAFGLDAARIDGRLAQVRQARARGGVQPVNVQLPGQPAGQGARLLADARNELRSGKITLARRLAEDAYRNHAEVRAEAEGVLRMIDIEEHNQARLEAERTFDAAVSAFNRRDWDHAGRLFRSFDPRLLDGTRQARLKEYMSVPEMQPHAAPLAQASPAVGSPAPGGIKPTVLTGPGDVGRAVATDTSREAEFARQTAAMQNVKFQALQAKAQEVQRQAMERARAGDLQTAIELLNDFYGELVLGGDPKEGGLSPDQLALLRRPVDTRMQQYKTLLAQKKFEELQTQGKRTTVASRAQQALKEDEKQKKVAALMKQYNELFKEGKYQEAEVLAMQARELDPDNPVATAAVTMAKMQRRLVDYRSIKDQKEEYFLTEMNEAEKVGPAATHENPMLFDQKRWKKAHDRKPYDGVVGTKSEKEQEIERRLLQPVNLNFSDTPLSQVLDDLRTYQGVNIVVDKPALEEAMIREDSRVSIKLDNVSLKSALNLI
ncbi:MAG TPA: hypothetical protein VFA26_14330, partial [Gemmataceae bacterium]|nr:hypothetical protein [Gemmataceae bacterium]